MYKSFDRDTASGGFRELNAAEVACVSGGDWDVLGYMNLGIIEFLPGYLTFFEGTNALNMLAVANGLPSPSAPDETDAEDDSNEIVVTALLTTAERHALRTETHDFAVIIQGLAALGAGLLAPEFLAAESLMGRLVANARLRGAITGTGTFGATNIFFDALEQSIFHDLVQFRLHPELFYQNAIDRYNRDVLDTGNYPIFPN